MKKNRHKDLTLAYVYGQQWREIFINEFGDPNMVEAFSHKPNPKFTQMALPH